MLSSIQTHHFMDSRDQEFGYEVVYESQKGKRADSNTTKEFLNDDDKTVSTAVSTRPSYSEPEEIESGHSRKCSATDADSKSQEVLTLALINSIFKEKEEPPMHDLALNLNNASMSDKSELTMDTMRFSQKHVKTATNLELLNALRKAVQSQMTRVGTKDIESKEHRIFSAQLSNALNETTEPSKNVTTDNMNVHIGANSTDDTATMTTISEDSSEAVKVTNILTTKSSNVSHGNNMCDASTLSSKTFFSSDFTVTDNFRFERLHTYGKKQQQLWREIDAIQKVETIKREHLFNLRFKEKKKKMRQKSSFPPPEKRGQRIHDVYSVRKNEEGRKRREAIQRKNELSAQQRRVFNIRI